MVLPCSAAMAAVLRISSPNAALDTDPSRNPAAMVNRLGFNSANPLAFSLMGAPPVITNSLMAAAISGLVFSIPANMPPKRCCCSAVMLINKLFSILSCCCNLRASDASLRDRPVVLANRSNSFT